MPVTKAKAEKVLGALKIQQKASLAAGYAPPVLMKDFDGRKWTILWEEGPYQWPQYLPDGGIEEEFGFNVKDVSESIPEGVFVEAINHYSVAIYPV